MSKFCSTRYSLLIAVLGAVASIPASADVFFKDGFETGGFSHSENGVSWNSPEKVTVVSDRASEGSRAAKFHFIGSSDLAADAWAELRFALPSNRSEIWIKYDMYIPSNYYHREASGASNNKGLIMLWGGDYGSMTTQSAISFWPSFSSARPGQSMMCADVKTNGGESTHYCQQSNLPDKGVTAATETIAINPNTDGGKWHTFIIHYKLSDVNTSNGVLQLWKDGTKIWDTNNVSNHAASTGNNYFNNGYILGWSNSGFNVDTDIYLDNVFFADTAADLNVSSLAPSPPTDAKAN